MDVVLKFLRKCVKSVKHLDFLITITDKYDNSKYKFWIKHRLKPNQKTFVHKKEILIQIVNSSCKAAEIRCVSFRFDTKTPKKLVWSQFICRISILIRVLFDLFFNRIRSKLKIIKNQYQQFKSPNWLENCFGRLYHNLCKISTDFTFSLLKTKIFRNITFKGHYCHNVRELSC